MIPAQLPTQGLNPLIVDEFNEIFRKYNQVNETEARIVSLSGKKYTVSRIKSQVACGAPSLCLVCKEKDPNKIEVYGPTEYSLQYRTKKMTASHKLTHYMANHPEAIETKEVEKLTRFFKHVLTKK